MYTVTSSTLKAELVMRLSYLEVLEIHNAIRLSVHWGTRDLLKLAQIN